MEIVVGQVHPLDRGRQDVAADEGIEFPVGKMIGEVEHHPLGVELLDRLPEPLSDLFVVERAGRLQGQRGLEPAGDRHQRRPLPRQHRFQEPIFDGGGQEAEVDFPDRLIQVGLDFIAQFAVA